VQEEEFSGPLGFVMSAGAIGRLIGFREKTRKGFEGYNADLKRWVEGGEN